MTIAGITEPSAISEDAKVSDLDIAPCTGAACTFPAHGGLGDGELIGMQRH